MIIKIVYIANIIVAGWIGTTSLFYPKVAVVSIFENTYPYSEYIRLIGTLWLGIAILSVFGLFKPINFSPVLLIQLVYKSAWLLVVALPAMVNKNPYPKSMSLFFAFWVLVLPFVIPWKHLFQN